MAKKKTIGKTMLELEKVLDEMVELHELQMVDILNLIYGHLRMHRPDCLEEFEDGSEPKFRYE